MRDMKEKLSAATEESAEYIPVRARKKIFKAAAAVTVAAAFAVGACVFVPKFFEESAPNVVDEGFVTVSAPVPEDGSTPDMHTALENIAYMNAAFKAQESWYSEMHGTTDASIMKQSVSTFKQYSDGVLIVADITSSAMVKAARQFCYTGDEVMWRLGSTYDASSFEEMLSCEWKSGEPYAHMYLKDFIAENGLPATEFSVYIINEETLLSADEVIKNQDGTYSQTYYLDPAGDKAPAHYANQMVFSGGLTALPEFTSIRITYTFDDEWQVLESVVEESYKATMGISVSCSSAFTTQYEYGTERAKSSAYEDYFKQYAGSEVSGPEEEVPTAVGCLGEAFGSVLTGPVVFDLSLTLNDTPLEGAVYLDIGDMTPDTISLRADFGILQLWMEEGEAYLQYGGIRGKLAVEEIMEALPLSEGGAGLDLDALLAGLGEGEFSYDETSASLSAQLSLGSLSLPVQFSFLLDENGHASLGNVSTQIEREGLALSLELAYGKEAPAALPEAEKADFPDLLPHLRTIASLLTSDAVRAEIAYEGSIAGEAVSLRGVLNVPLASGAVGGELALTLHGAEKQLSFAYSDGAIFLEVDGLKLKADAEEAISFLGQYLELPALETEGLSFDLDTLLESALSGELSSLVSVSGKEEALIVAVKGNELLELLGMDLGTFGLGEVVLTSENGVVTAEALGASIAISEGELVSVDADAYTDILPYAKTLADIFSTGYFRADVDIDIENFNIFGTVYFGIDPVVVRAKLYLSTGGLGKLVTVEYAGDDLFAIIDGVTLRLDAEELISLLTSSLPLGSEEEKEAVDYLHNFLSLDFSKVVPSLSEEDGVLSLIVNGNEIMRALGIKYLTGNIELAVGDGSLSASCEALHFDITLYKGNPVYINSEQDCIDVQPVLQKLLKMIEEKAFSFDGSISVEAGGVQLPVNIQRGTLSWEYGFSVTLEGELSLGGGWHRFFLSADSTRVRIAYGGLGISLAYDEFPALAETLFDAFADLAPLAENFGITLPDLSSLSGALQNLDGLLGGFDLASFDLGALLSGLTMTEVPGGLFGLSGENITLTVADERFGIARVGVEYAGEDFRLGMGLSLDEFEEPLTMPRITYLGLDDLKDLAEYLTAAAGTVNGNSVKLTLEPVTTSAGQIAAEAELYHGEDFPVRIDTDKKTITISADCYLHLNVSVTALKEGDLPLYVEAWVLDGVDGDRDGMLDFYVTVSRMQEGEAGYKPLVVTASAQELLPLVASALPLLGIDSDFVNDYFVGKWLDSMTADRLSVIGDSLLDTLDFFGVFDELFGGAAGGTASGELIAAVVKGEDTFSLTLGGGALGMGSDLVLGLEKTADAEGAPLLKAVSLAFGGTDIAFGLSYDTITPAVPTLPAGQKYELDGMPELFTALANTATHTDGGSYELNRTYVMKGSASLALGFIGVTVNIEQLAVSIEEDGNIVLDAELSYDSFLGSTIKGSTLDLSINDGMIYMCRKSTKTVWNGIIPEEVEEVLYRAMPLSVFGATLKDQLVFMFNMSSRAAKLIPDDMGGSGSEESGDLGTQAGNILSSYEYRDGAWKLTLNGGALTGDVLDNIVVTLGAKDGLISKLDVSSSLVNVLTLSANLTLENAGENYENVGEIADLSGEVSEGMSAAIGENNENGWTTYLEGTKSTVSFVADGETVRTQDVFVNGSKVLSELSYPELEEREGYTASGWTQNGLTYTAKYVPNVYFLHFESDRAVEGWSQENGKWTFTLEYAYGTQGFELPFAKDLEQYIAYFTDEAGNRYRSAEDLLTVLSDKTLTAVWEEREYTVTYTDGDTVLGSEILHYGDVLTFPQAPEKEGYQFVGWDTAESTVTGDMTIEALYEPLSFTVTIVSSLPYEGFVEAENNYIYTFEYTYGSSAIRMDDLSDVSGYWFGGFYTRPDGKGNQVNAVEGILSDTTYYVYWQDNTVRVRLYSDLELEGSQKDEEGYFIEKTFNDTYALSDAPAIEGYRQLGWWVESDGGWKPVDDVLEFYGQDDVRVWAVWMQEIEIGIGDFSVNVTGILVTYNIHGTVEGGKIVGAHGSQIFPNEPTKEVNYLVYGNGKQDVLSGGKAEAIEEGAFGKSKMTCFNFGSTMNTAPYGGAKVTHIFTYLDADGTTQSVSTTDEATVSLESYTIVYRDEDGAELKRMEVRGSYGAQLTLADLGLPEVPEKMGHEGSWDKEGEYVIDSGDRQYAASSGGGLSDLVLSHTIEVRPVYTAKLYPVTLTAQDDVQIDGWTGDNYTLKLHFGDVILFEQSGNSLGSYTVGTENEVLLPKLTSGAYWCAVEETEQGILIRAMKDPDHVTLYDAFGGESEVSFDTVYTPDAPSPQDGFTFLGWWKETDNGWEKADSLAYTGGGNQFALYALWVKLGNVSASSDKKTLTVTAEAPQFKSAHEDLSASGTIEVAYSVNHGGFWGIGSKTETVTVEVCGSKTLTFDGKINKYSLTGKTLIYTMDGETYELQF